METRCGRERWNGAAGRAWRREKSSRPMMPPCMTGTSMTASVVADRPTAAYFARIRCMYRPDGRWSDRQLLCRFVCAVSSEPCDEDFLIPGCDPGKPDLQT